MRIYLARHGHALTKQEDPDRPLSETGRKEVSHVADILEQTGAGVDRLIHSGKPRAVQTAEILAQSVMWDVEMETASDMNPTDPVEPWVDRISRMTEDTMLVGHLPFLSRLASRLVTGSEEPEVARFHSGAVACLEQSPEGKWAVVCMTPPSL
jgi:phosphohistidine phosphatase